MVEGGPVVDVMLLRRCSWGVSRASEGGVSSEADDIGSGFDL